MSQKMLSALGIGEKCFGMAVGGEFKKTSGTELKVKSPIDGSVLSTIATACEADVEAAIHQGHEAFLKWRTVPAPKRGEFVRRLGNKLREKKKELGELVSWEAGKITQEAQGEVQEMIDICDFAVGLSRQLYGLTIASERPGHRMMEQWHPLGAVGVITAFNFPVAVWAWNAALALVCGDSVVWKPSNKTPLTAVAVQNIVGQVLKEMPEVPPGVATLVICDRGHAGAQMAAHPKLPLISANGSERMGVSVGQAVAKRFGRALLELGGNNAMIVSQTADMELAIRAIVFAAVGTCGQRCTSLRRLIVHKSIKENLLKRLQAVYGRLKIGNPLEDGVLVGPLVDEGAWDAMSNALEACKREGAKIYGGDRIKNGVPGGGTYVKPALVEIKPSAAIIKEETFAPILYVMEYETMEQAVAIHNDVPQGLSSAIFTSDVREAEFFMSPAGSDCGIANVNIGTSGAEIGGAFGGEKSTGGGRESGSDSWKQYMRRVTNTINYSKELPLAQGIEFGL